MNEIRHQPASPGPVCTYWHITVSKALPNQEEMSNNYDSKIITTQPYILQLPTHYHHLCFLPIANPAAVQQHWQNGKGNRLNEIIQRQKPNRPQYDRKWMVYTIFVKGHYASGNGQVVTPTCTSDVSVSCCRENWVELGVLLCCISPCRQSTHRVNTVKHCTMPLRTATSRHGPRVEPTGGVRECTLVLLRV